MTFMLLLQVFAHFFQIKRTYHQVHEKRSIGMKLKEKKKKEKKGERDDLRNYVRKIINR
jgi:hypothetical protein